MPVPQEKYYTVDEFLALTLESNERLELRDGEIVAMASPSEIHQTIVKRITSIVDNYIITNKGSCVVYPSPFDVKLDDCNLVIPDISIICDRSKLDGKRCNGAPDWIVEVVSSNSSDDYVRKFQLYKKFGVREYWIVDPSKNMTFVWYYQEPIVTNFYDFSKNIPVSIYKDNPIKLEINIANLLNL